MKRFGKSEGHGVGRAARRTMRPAIELFEDRTLLSFVVMSTGDSGPGTLRQAITDANASGQASTIDFNIPGPGPFVITPATVLPSIAVPTVIDGTTESTFLGSPAVVELDGGGQSFDGLTLASTVGGSTINGLDIADFAGNGIVIMSSGNAVTDDLIGTDPTGSAAGPGNQAGIVIQGSNNSIGGTTIGTADTIAFNSGDAIDVQSGTGNAIRQSAVFANGSAIVLAPGANNDIVAPTVLAVASVPSLTTVDYSVTGAVGQSYTLDFFASSSLGGPAAVYLGSVTTPALTSATQSFTASFPLATPITTDVTATVTDAAGDTSAFAASTAPASPFLVTNTSDEVPGSAVGSLRLAIEDANLSPPSSGTDAITFAIPGTSPFVISPVAVLPTIAVPVTIDGTTESTFLGTPAAVELDGGGQSFDGLTLASTSGGSTINGLDIADFAGNGIVIVSSGNAVTDDLIGTDPTGSAAGPGNQAGIVIQGSDNSIGGTTSGTADTIAFNSGDAIDVQSGTGNAIRQSTVFANGSAIVLAPGANNDIGAPTIRAAASVPSLTTVDYSVTGAVGQSYTLDFFASSTPGGPAAVYLGSETTPALTSATQSFTASLSAATPVGAGQTVTATVTDAAGDTSAFAASVAPASPFLVTSTSDEVPGSAVGSLRLAIRDADFSPPSSGTDAITFAIPGTSPFVISPVAVLPAITVPVTVDGTTQAGVELNGAGQSFNGLTLASTSSGSTIRGLTILGFAGDGIDILSNNNTITDDQIGGSTAVAGNGTAVAINGQSNTVGGTTSAAANTIGFNTQAGVAVVAGSGNVVRANQYVGTNGPATPVPSDDIVLSAGANNNQPAPALGTTQLVGSQLTVFFTDAVASGTTVTLDVYLVNPSSTPAEREYLGSGSAVVGTGSSSVVVTVPGNIILGDQIIATATVAANGTSAFSGGSTITTPFLVTNINDTGPGSLRNAITAADSTGSTATSYIAFFILSPGPFIIDLLSVLPTITVPMVLDATTQPTYAGAPVVELDGRGGAFNGLTLVATASGSTIKGLDIADFQGDGIDIGSSDDTIVNDNIGTDLSGAAPGPGNLNGIVVTGSNNSIGGTASGTAVTIAFNSDSAVDVQSGSGNSIRQSPILANASAILLGSGANDNIVTPTILAVASVPLLTTIDYQITGAIGQSYTLDFFTSDALGGPAAVFLDSVTTTPLTSATESFTASLPLATPIATAVTATVTDAEGNTSAFASGTAPASPFLVTNTNDGVPGSAVGSLRLAIEDADLSPPASGTDPITFAIPGTSPFVIATAEALPTITVPVTIDGASESTFLGSASVVELDGGGGAFNGLTLGVGSGSSTIAGLEVLAFGGSGIVVQSPGDTIGGTTAGAGNVIGQNAVAGIQIEAGGSGTAVLGNTIGNPTTAGLGNGYGVQIVNADDETIGGLGSAANTIGYNTTAGIAILSGSGNEIEENKFVGTNGTSDDVPEDDINVASGANNGPPALQLLGAVYIPDDPHNGGADDLYVTLQFSPSFTTGVGETVSFDFYTDDAGDSPPSRDFLAGTAAGAVSSQPFTLRLSVPSTFSAADEVLAIATFVSAPPTAPSGSSAFSNQIDSTSPTVVYTTADSLTPTIEIGGATIAGVAGSLRFAINYANSFPTPTPTISFDIPTTDPNFSAGTYTIALAGLLPDIQQTMVIDGSTEPGSAAIFIDGEGASGNGLTLAAGSSSSTVEGLVIGNFDGAGIQLDSSGNLVLDNHIGTNAEAHKLDNRDGIEVYASSNTIQGNTIGFNSMSGIVIAATTAGASVGDNLVIGNDVGTDASGDNVGNLGLDGGAGILIEASDAAIKRGSASVFGNSIGGVADGDANTIGFNGGAGVEIEAVQGSASNAVSAVNNVVEGNFIGGLPATPTANGVAVPVPTPAPNTGPAGIWLVATGPSVSLSGNVIGGAATVTGQSGALGPAANFVWDNQGDGIAVSLAGAGSLSSVANTIEGNLVSRNQLNGIHVIADLTGDMTVGAIADNDVGTDPTGTTTYDAAGNPWGNVLSGILVEQAGSIGGTTSATIACSITGNVLSGNGLSGVTVQRYAPTSSTPGAATARVSIAGNIIGLDRTGTNAIVYNTAAGSTGGVALPLGNALDGVLLDNVVGVIVGSTLDGTVPATPSNVISGNLGRGVEVRGDALSSALPGLGNTIQGNFIGTDITGKAGVQTVTSNGTTNTYTLGNLSDGIFLYVPPATTIQDNVISNNRAAGIHAAAQSGTTTPTGPLVIAGNDIGTNAGGTSASDVRNPSISLGNGSDGIFIDSITSGVTIGGTAATVANVISGNRADGIDLLDTIAVFVGSNLIGTDAAGAGGLGNSSNGIFLNGSSHVSIGGSGFTAANVISGNLDNGILLANDSTDNLISGNRIGTDPTGTFALSNSGDGIFLLGGAATMGATVTAGGTITGNVISGNVISGNAEYGVEVFGPGATQNTILGNTIGATAAGAAGPTPPGNGADGVYLNNDAGGNVVGPGNVISGNGQSGVLIFGTSDNGGHDLIEGDRIGTDPSASAPVPNGGNGVFIFGTSFNAISGNTVSGNAQAGVAIFSPAGSAPAAYNTVSGNLIGGPGNLGNDSDGVDVFSGVNNAIGQLGSWNTISGNAGNGVVLATVSNQAPDNNTVSGNVIGVVPGAPTSVRAQQNGVLVENGTGNQIGVAMGASIPNTNAPASPSNVIAGNQLAGVQFSGTASGNFVQGDYIGVNGSGTGSSGNGLAGVFVNNLGTSPSDETIGGTAPGAGNIIGGSTSGDGVDILGPVGDATRSGNVVEGNLIGVDLDGNPAGNGIGVLIQNSWGNQVGAPGAGKNVISANAKAGVELTGLYSTRNTIQGNFIGTDPTGTMRPGGVGPLTDVAPASLQTYGVYIDTPSPTFAITNPGINNQVIGNVISGNLIGIAIEGIGSGTGTNQGVPFGQDVVSGNFVGTDPTGTAPNPNFEYGAYINNSAGNTVGGSTPGSGNVLSANGVDGVEIFGGTTQSSSSSNKTGAAAARNVIIGNIVGDNASGKPGFTGGGGPQVAVPDGPTITLGQQLYGVVVIGSSGNIIGSDSTGNTIGGNVEAGVYITRIDFQNAVFAVPTNNTLNSNVIAFNGIYGVYRYESPGNPVAMRPQRHANTFRRNPINLADYTKSLNTNTQLPRLQSRYSHHKKKKARAVVRVHHDGRPAAHPAAPERAVAAHPARPRIPALFADGVRPKVIDHHAAKAEGGHPSHPGRP